jgi:hypothetical protein
MVAIETCYMIVWCECFQPKNKDKDKDKDKGQAEDDKKQEGEKLGCGRVIPIKQVNICVAMEMLTPPVYSAGWLHMYIVNNI